MRVREPAVAGTFYPGGRSELGESIRAAYAHKLGPGSSDAAPSRCVICPHAGYEYSAHVACHSVRALAAARPRGPVVIIGPEHACAGSGAAVSAAGSWRTPLGDAAVDRDASESLAEISGAAVSDAVHAAEHSIEVIVPLLQDALGDALRIVPVALSDQDAGTASDVGRAAGRIASELDGAVVASSDLTHYEPDAEARRKDAALIARVAGLDAEGMYAALAGLRISACGYGAMAAAIAAAREMGAQSGRALAYATSADAGGGEDSVVGYAAVAFS